MSLSVYKTKRSFQKTPEPQGQRKSSSSEGFHFVVQKHDASRLHYDFRLEMEGVLKSWAVPKGPSLNPDDKRLAMMVEDHPFDYRSFEGIIPEGNYGAGTVIVWDEGTYEPIGETEGGLKQQEKELLKQLKAGNLKFRLKGKKLKGEYALVHINGRQENAWLLIKKKDKYASASDVTEKDKSVHSGKTLAQVEKNNKRTPVKISSRPARTQKSSTASKKQAIAKKNETRIHKARKGATKKR